MSAIKISSKVDEQVWRDLKAMAEENHCNVSGLLTQAIADYVRKHRVRPDVVRHMEDSIRDNQTLGHLLAK